VKDLIQLEVIACDVADARAAAEGGADRLELLSEPERGGLTPSWGRSRPSERRSTSPSG
jgi:copper homeostasis protein CutC